MILELKEKYRTINLDGNRYQNKDGQIEELFLLLNYRFIDVINKLLL
jgi:hypothetical protein